MSEKNTNIELLANEARNTLNAALAWLPSHIANEVRKKQAAYLDAIIAELENGRQLFIDLNQSHAAELERVREEQSKTPSTVSDWDIIKVIQSIFSNATFTVETMNESILVKLMELRGTPITGYKTLRDIEKDYRYFLGEKDIYTNTQTKEDNG